MHTVWVRLNAVVFFGLTVLLGLSCLAAFSKIGHSYIHQPIINTLELNTLRSLKSHGGVDRALLSFNIDADMNPAFHWNVKQLFVYVVASYETSSKEINDVVIWDKIIENIDSVEDKHIKQENVFVKYALVDQGNELRGKDVSLRLMWDHMPITGFVYMDSQAKDTTTSFSLPLEYK
ncbi:unnamed protein product [Pseudo-nitzschia multistriata]|uniref:Signal peptidase complex subunit 3 n=1 Tax=Pseudo-nitzschia multistriata TaxID=183589 RepID=A0A448Z0X0_9STRA|nr:unnamed protein product [Pseudo-nitzschia multistriata]